MEYDFRGRRLTERGEAGLFKKYLYDNLGQTIQVEQKNADDAGNPVGLKTMDYDDRGRLFRANTYAVNISNGEPGNALEENTYYDAAGRTIKVIDAGNGHSFTSMVYDNLGRIRLKELGYPGGSGDVIVSREETFFDEAGNRTYIESSRRNTDATPANTFRTGYTAFWYDGLNREIARARYGVSSPFTRSGLIPTRSGVILVTSRAYDSDGRVFKTIDPRGLVEKKVFDQAGRLTQQIDNYDPNATAPGDSVNCTIDLTYNADSLVETATARQADQAKDEQLTYAYGTTLTESDVALNNLLRSIDFPDGRNIEYEYNRQGQRKTATDQAGTTRGYLYDGLGRKVQDMIQTFGSA
ncbi:MAG: hypothetical protein AAF492_31155, partial [Verrucomicrobiota bacterium]